MSLPYWKRWWLRCGSFEGWASWFFVALRSRQTVSHSGGVRSRHWCRYGHLLFFLKFFSQLLSLICLVGKSKTPHWRGGYCSFTFLPTTLQPPSWFQTLEGVMLAQTALNLAYCTTYCIWKFWETRTLLAQMHLLWGQQDEFAAWRTPQIKKKMRSFV